MIIKSVGISAYTHKKGIVIIHDETGKEKSFLVICFLNKNLVYFKQISHLLQNTPQQRASKVKPCFGRKKKISPTNTQLLLLRHTRCSRNTPLPPLFSPDTHSARTHTNTYTHALKRIQYNTFSVPNHRAVMVWAKIHVNTAVY